MKYNKKETIRISLSLFPGGTMPEVGKKWQLRGYDPLGMCGSVSEVWVTEINEWSPNEYSIHGIETPESYWKAQTRHYKKAFDKLKKEAGNERE